MVVGKKQSPAAAAISEMATLLPPSALIPSYSTSSQLRMRNTRFPRIKIRLRRKRVPIIPILKSDPIEIKEEDEDYDEEEEEYSYLKPACLLLAVSIPPNYHDVVERPDIEPSGSSLRHMAAIGRSIFTRQFLSTLWFHRNRIRGILRNKIKLFSIRILKRIGMRKREEDCLEQRILVKKEEEILPPEIWGEIGKRIKSRLDIAHFRSTCKIFRLVLPAPTLFPVRVPPLPNCLPDLPDFPFIVTQLEYYKLKRADSSPFWQPTRLVGLEEHRRGGGGGGRFLTYGCLWKTWKQPLLSRLRFESKPQQLLSHISFISVAHHLRLLSPMAGYNADLITSSEMADKIVVISSSSSSSSVNLNYIPFSDLSLVALMTSGRLALLRLKGSFQDWVWETDFSDQVFHVIGVYQRKLCALDGDGRVVIMDYESLQMKQLTPPATIFCASSVNKKMLFEAFGDLHVSMESDDLGFKVYKFNFQLQNWIEVKSCADLFYFLRPFIFV